MRLGRWLGWVACMLMTTWAHAAGYYVSEIGSKAIGRGGAFVVNPDDPTAMWLNPAGLASVPGAQIYLASSWIHLNETYTRSCRPTCAPQPYERQYGENMVRVGQHPGLDPRHDDFQGDINDHARLNLGRRGDSVGTVKNISQGRLVPYLSMAMNGELWGVPGLGVGVAVYGPNTGGVSFPEDGPQRYAVVGSKPVEALVEVAAAYRFNRYFTVGAGLALERLGTEIQTALSADKDGRETRGRDIDAYFNANEDFIPTMILGFNSNPVAGLEFGGSFMPPRQARAVGPIRLTPAGTELQNDLGLTIDDQNALARLHFFNPAVARMGVRYNLPPWFDVELALVREFWSTMQFIKLEIEGLEVNAGGTKLGLPATIQPKEYRDTWALRTGGDFHAIPGIFTMRVGAFAEESAIPDQTLDVSVADGRKIGLGGGMTLGYFGFQLTAAYQHIMIEPRVITDSLVVSNNPTTGAFPGAGGVTRAALGTYLMSHDVITAGVTMNGGEVLQRLRAAMDGDPSWWKPRGPGNKTVVNAARWLAKKSNL